VGTSFSVQKPAPQVTSIKSQALAEDPVVAAADQQAITTQNQVLIASKLPIH
jgi:hypothetical protein|tara:strand:- start:181 stop:336 length:156 start_codon:yes stop_codon:yes gene_type:complete